jgi:peptidoglycan/LPS O-acetylase OafA/YrhL
MATAVFQPAEISSKHRIPTLDGWRGVAILLVLVGHAAQYGRFKDQVWVSLGTFGVYIFFVVSGYIITSRLVQERAECSTIRLGRFYANRVFRILPVVVVYLVTLCLLSRFFRPGDFHFSEVMGSLFFFRNYQYAAHPQGVYTAHFWSLSIEEHFYLLWPALLFWAGNRRALWLALLASFGCGVWRIYDHIHPVSFLPGSTTALRSIRTDNMIDGLLLGSALGIIFAIPAARLFVHRNFTRGTPLILGVLLLFNLTRTHSLPDFSTFFLITLLLAATLAGEEGLTHRFLNSKPLLWVGTLSYSIYVWQQLFLFHPSNVFPLGRFNVFPLDLICVFVAASCCFYFIERPAIALGRKHRRTAVADQTPLITTTT